MNTMTIRTPFPIAAAMISLSACTSIDTTAATFEGTRWQVSEINSRAVPATHLYRIQFDGDQVTGRFGCNQFSGSYRIEQARLVVQDMASTLIGCPEPAASHEAQAFLVLSQPMTIDWSSGQRVTLGNAAGSIKLDSRN